MTRVYCSRCGEEVPRQERACPHCGESVPPEKIEIIEKIENYEERRRTLVATLLLGTFGIWLLPFSNIRILLALAAYIIAPIMIIYYTLKKRKLEERLSGFELV